MQARKEGGGANWRRHLQDATRAQDSGPMNPGSSSSGMHSSGRWLLFTPFPTRFHEQRPGSGRGLAPWSGGELWGAFCPPYQVPTQCAWLSVNACPFLTPLPGDLKGTAASATRADLATAESGRWPASRTGGVPSLGPRTAPRTTDSAQRKLTSKTRPLLRLGD